MAYNYEKFSAGEYDLGNFRGPETGTKAPDFELTDVDANPRRLLDFDGQFLVIEMGSITCPLFQSRRTGMARAVSRHPHSSFVVLYIREAHPGAAIGQHADMADKQARARAVRDEDGEGRTILVDGMAGEAHKAYGEYPNAVFIVNRNGCIVYRSDWNDQAATDRALTQLEAGKPATALSLFKPALPPVAIHTLRRSGRGAGLDFIKGLPVLIWNNLLMRNWRLLTGRPEKVSASATC
jgi:iodothyronine deiodinase-like protein